MKKLYALTVTALLASTGTAHANDFNGFRLEVQTGFDATSALEKENGKYTVGGVTETESDQYRGTKTGVLLGAAVGYDAEISSNIVAGIEASLSFSNAKLDNLDYDIDLNDDETFYAEELKARREIELAARLGYKVNPSTLIYVKGGYVNGRFKLNGETEFFNDAEEEWDYRDQSFSENRSGYRLGAGIETLLSSNAFAKLEYRYTNYKDIKYSYSETGGTGPSAYSYDYKYSLGLSRHQAVAAVGIRF